MKTKLNWNNCKLYFTGEKTGETELATAIENAQSETDK